MTAIRQMLDDYLALRRDLGYKLLSAGTALLSFVGFLEEAGVEYISSEHAVTWALLPTSVQAVRWWRRLSFVRGFARYCVALDPRTEVPPADLLPYRYQRRAPFFFPAMKSAFCCKLPWRYRPRTVSQTKHNIA